MCIDIENLLISLKNNLEISSDIGDLLMGCFIDIIVSIVSIFRL